MDSGALDCWAVEKFYRMKDGKWTLVQKRNMTVKLHFDQLFLLSDDVVFESFKLNKILKGCLKDSVLVIIYQEEDKYNKLKFKFTCKEQELAKLIKIMEMYFTVNLFEGQTEILSGVKTQNMYETINSEMTRQSTRSNSVGLMFPENFPFNNFMKTCLLDPDFPKLVDQAENFIKNTK